MYVHPHPFNHIEYTSMCLLYHKREKHAQTATFFFSTKLTDAKTQSFTHGFSSDFFFVCRTCHRVACNCSRKETIRLSCVLHSEKKQRGEKNPAAAFTRITITTLESLPLLNPRGLQSRSGFMWLFVEKKKKTRPNRI